MTWAEIGWLIIVLGAVLLMVFNLLFKRRFRYQARTNTAVQSYLDDRIRAVERGEICQVLLGDQFWSRAYPGLGLHALSVFNNLTRIETIGDGGQITAVGTGELALFARQIVQGSYQDGFSTGLSVTLPGPTSLSFVAGFLADLGFYSPGSVGLFGNYGQMGAVLAEATVRKGGHSFAAAGSITAQAALFLNTHDLLIGEEIYLLPGLIEHSPGNQAGWVTEDILRVLLMAFLIIAAGLKMAGIL